MTFAEVVDQTLAMLQRRGRVTYHLLKRQFDLDDGALEDLKLELIKGQRLAVDEEGEVLVWAGARGTISGSAHPPPLHPQQRATQDIQHVPLVLLSGEAGIGKSLDGSRPPHPGHGPSVAPPPGRGGDPPGGTRQGSAP
jgi:hypothetical protein